VSCEGSQRDKRKRWCGYIARPAVAVPRLSLSSTGKFAELDNAFVSVINLSGELPDVLHKGAKGLSELEGGDYIRFMAFHDQIFISAQTTYLQWQSNTLDESLWSIIRHACFDLLSQPGQQEWWKIRRH
jgi:hypothetical protein